MCSEKRHDGGEQVGEEGEEEEEEEDAEQEGKEEEEEEETLELKKNKDVVKIMKCFITVIKKKSLRK